MADSTAGEDVPSAFWTAAAIDTGLHADAVEFCPTPGLQDVLACATYQLDGETRVGRLLLFSVAGKIGHTRVCEHARVETTGIFDARWHPRALADDGQSSAIALACADGTVGCHRVSRTTCPEDDGDGCNVSAALICTRTLPECDGGPTPFCLSADWDCGALGVDAGDAATVCAPPSGLACSDNHGRMHSFAIDGSAEPVTTWRAHDLEIWIVAFHRSEANLVLSGADDCLLRGWDTRQPQRPAFTSKCHSMGVTSIQSDPHSPHCILTGSYDERARVIDVRMPRQEVHAFELGGGVWTARWHPRVRGVLLAACMYNGFHVVRAADSGMAVAADAGPVDREAATANAERFTTNPYSQHGVGDALAYGADWCYEPPSAGDSALLAATCSFYDHTLHVWHTTVDADMMRHD